MRLDVTAEALLQQKVAGAVATLSGAGAWLSTVQAWALELLGVPLPVVLAAATGAFGARFFIAEGPFWRGLGASLLWTLAGAFGVQFALWLGALWIAAAPPAGALAGGALVIAGPGQLVAPEVLEALRRRIRTGRWSQGGADA